MLSAYKNQETVSPDAITSIVNLFLSANQHRPLFPVGNVNSFKLARKLDLIFF